MANLTETIEKIDELISYHTSIETDMTSGSWPWPFVHSIRSRCIDSDRELTPRQQEVLGDVLQKWSQSAIESRDSAEREWKEQLTSDHSIKERLRLVINSLNAELLCAAFMYRGREVYQRKDVFKTGFWTRLRARFDATEELTRKDYDRLMDNRFSQALIKAMESDCKYPVGQLVAIKPTMLNKQSRKINNYKILDSVWHQFDKKNDAIVNDTTLDGDKFARVKEHFRENHYLCGLVIEHNPVPSLSNARGCRPYRIMPVGDWMSSGQTLILEERWIRKMPKKV